MPQNRKLDITVEFDCIHNAADDSFGGGATYRQTNSTPDMGTIVDANGKIDFAKATGEAEGFNNNVDITFTLETPCSVSPDNTTLNVAWATQYGPGMKVTDEHGNDTNEMSVQFDPSQPNVITILDKDDDTNTYNYKPAVELIRPGHNNYYISLDPKIVNRPTR